MATLRVILRSLSSFSSFWSVSHSLALTSPIHLHYRTFHTIKTCEERIEGRGRETGYLDLEKQDPTAVTVSVAHFCVPVRPFSH